MSSHDRCSDIYADALVEGFAGRDCLNLRPVRTLQLRKSLDVNTATVEFVVQPLDRWAAEAPTQLGARGPGLRQLLQNPGWGTAKPTGGGW